MESGENTHFLEVECYSGYKADERPVSFILSGYAVNSTTYYM
jgi:hypothetical protein